MSENLELCSPESGAVVLKEVNVDSKSMGDAVLWISGFGVAELERNGNGVSGRLGLCSSRFGTVDSKEVNVDSKAIGDAVLSSSDSEAADLEGYGVSGRLELRSPGLGTVDSKELNVDSKSMGDAVLSSSHSPAAESYNGDGSGVTRSKNLTLGLRANFTPLFGREGGGGGAVVRDGRSRDIWTFPRCFGPINSVRLLT